MKPKITFAVPIHRFWSPESEQSLLENIHHAKNWQLGSILKVYEESLIQRGRNLLLENFLKTDSDYLFFLDDDVVLLDDNAVDKLVEAEADIIGGMVVCKKPPFRPNWLPLGLKYDDLRGKEHPVRVRYVSTSCMLIRREVCKEIKRSSKYPFDCFEIEIPDRGNVYLSEDWAFCERARENAFLNISIHPKVSCGHIGKYIYNMEDFYSFNNIKEEK